MKDAPYYKKQQSIITQRYHIILNELLKTSISVDKTRLKQVHSDFFSLKNQLEKDMQVVNIKASGIDKEIAKIEAENIILAKRLTGLQDDKNSALQLFDDVQQQYNHYALGNWFLVVSMIGCGLLYFRKK